MTFIVFCFGLFIRETEFSFLKEEHPVLITVDIINYGMLQLYSHRKRDNDTHSRYKYLVSVSFRKNEILFEKENLPVMVEVEYQVQSYLDQSEPI